MEFKFALYFKFVRDFEKTKNRCLVVIITSDKCYLNIEKKSYKESDQLEEVIIIVHLKHQLKYYLIHTISLIYLKSLI